MKFKSGLARLMSIGLLLTLCFGNPIVGKAAEDKQGVFTEKPEDNGGYIHVFTEK